MTTANTSTQTNFKVIVLFVLVMLFSNVSFAQSTTTTTAPATTTEVSVSKDATMTITTDNSVAAGMDFAVWFTGAKKTSNTTSNGTFSKKQLINAGIKTNSVLVRSFLKKMNSQENGVA